MTLVAVWLNDEEPESPRLWMASDSRISDAEGTLIDEGIKLYELPVICRKPGTAGLFDTPYFATTIGLACAGSTLLFQHVYATLVPVFGNLIGDGTEAPSTAGLSAFAGNVATAYVRSLGGRRPQTNLSVSLVVAGHYVGRHPEAFELRPSIDPVDGLVAFSEHALELSEHRVHFFGDQIVRADALLSLMRANPEPGCPFERAPLNVLRALIDDPEIRSIGGEIAIGFSNVTGFRRTTTVVPEPGQEPRALSLLNGIDLDAFGPIGPCAIGLPGMISP